MLKSQTGITLVELLVAVALFGVLSMGASYLLVQSVRFGARAKNATTLSESILEFSEAADVYLTNVTRVFSCGCGQGCVFNSDTPDCVKGTACGSLDPLLEFETEDANEPGALSTGACEFAGENPRTGSTGEGLLARGCKRRLKLVLDRTAQALRFVDPKTEKTLHEIRGITWVRCGQTGAGLDPPRAVPYGFEFEIRAETENGNGVRREIRKSVPFRNLTVYGVHFGKPYTVSNCTPDGKRGDQGSCCSGFQEGGGRCVALNNCLVRGESTGGSGEEAQCCSHQVGAGGACL